MSQRPDWPGCFRRRDRPESSRFTSSAVTPSTAHIGKAEAGQPDAVTYLVERLLELRRHLDHLRAIRPRVTGREALERDLSLHNDVLFSLLTGRP